MAWWEMRTRRPVPRKRPPPQAWIAAASFGFRAKPPPPPPPKNRPPPGVRWPLPVRGRRAGRVTPCALRQLRNAVPRALPVPVAAALVAEAVEVELVELDDPHAASRPQTASITTIPHALCLLPNV